MLAVAAAWQFFSFNGFPNDHYVHVARARQMLLGDWPVRDFVDPGLPLTYAISAAARWLFGDVAGAELFVVAVGVAIGAAATVISASWLTRSAIVGCTVAFLQILASPRTYSYPKLMLYGLGSCVIVGIAQRGSRAWILAAAALTAAAFLMRHDHGLYLGVASAIAIVFSSPGVAEALRSVGTFAAVSAVLLLPWAIWVQVYAGLVSYFASAIAFSRREADISLMRDLPRLQVAEGLSTANLQAWLFYLFYALPVVCILLSAFRGVTRRQAWKGESAAVFALSVLALLVDAGFLRNPLETRLADATVPASLLGAWLLGLAWMTPLRLPVAVLVRTAATALLVMTTIAVWRVGDVRDKLDEIGAFDDLEHLQEHAGGLVHVLTHPENEARKLPSRVSAGLVPFFHYLDRCSATSDRLLVSGPYPDVFVLARRGFAGGHIAFMEAFYNSDAEQSRTLERMRQESVPFVVLPLDDQDAFARSFPKVLAHITSNYELLADIPVEGLKGVRILVERSRRPSGVDSMTGWPCFASNGGTT
jgi:hypothetical protein